MAPTLTDFLLARIAEDEETAQAGDGQDPKPLGYWDNARVLAECAAKRATLDALEDERQRKDIYNRGYDAGDLTTSDDLRNRLSSNARWAGLDLAARLMVQVYADHPGYDPGWQR